MKPFTFPKMHVSLYVSDIAKTTEFYTNFFGQEPAKVKDDYIKYIIDSPALIISFLQNKERVQPNFGHLGFQVDTKEELQKRLNLAKKLNLVTLEEEETSCCYAVQDKFWVTDPDGIQWEVYYFHKDVTFNDPKYNVADSSACCTEKVEISLCCEDAESTASCC